MTRHPRHLLLPKWIRFFSWIFLVVGSLVGVIAIIGFVFNLQGNFMLFGLRYAGPLREALPASMGVAFAGLGYAAFALLWGRKEGRIAGLVAGYAGLAMCATVMVLSLKSGKIYISIEPFLQVPFVISLHRLRSRWDNQPNKAPEPTPGAVTPRATEGTSE